MFSAHRKRLRRRPSIRDHRRMTPSDSLSLPRSIRPSYRIDAWLSRRHAGPVVGIDEAGRGPLAGPVVAACVMLDPDRVPKGLNDSKLLDAETREALFRIIARRARVGVGVAHVARIDRDNILQASLWAMGCAYAALGAQAAIAIVDGNIGPKSVACPVETLVGGDGKSASVAAASIVAKVVRDRMMIRLGQRFPDYGWERNKGYGTAEHLAALASVGVTPHHRRSFAPVARALSLAAPETAAA
jgi:ribonuclease HII